MAKNEEKGEIVLYQPEGEVRLEVRVEKESVWLSQMQMADLFQKDRTAIGRHIKNIYKEGELAKDITCANFARVGVDADQTYKLPMKGREGMKKCCFYTLFILYFVVVSTARRIWQCQFYKFA